MVCVCKHAVLMSFHQSLPPLGYSEQEARKAQDDPGLLLGQDENSHSVFKHPKSKLSSWTQGGFAHILDSVPNSAASLH